MIRYFCDVTGKEMIRNNNTKERLDFDAKIADRSVHMRAYFCVDNEGCGELSMEGIMLFMRAITDAYFNEVKAECGFTDCHYILDDGQCSFCPDSIPEDGMCNDGD